MSKLIDLTGQKFGRLTVLHKDEERITKSGSYWICQCECGKIKSVRSSSLRNGDIVSCGCFRMEKVMETKEARGLVDNLIGQRFGFLTVIEKDPERESTGAVKWICKCDCGNKVSIRGSNLKRQDMNRTISCGCYHISKGELEIKTLLDENQIFYSHQQNFSSLPNKRFDFAIFNEHNELQRLVEFDGEQHFSYTNKFWDTEEHFKLTQKRDQEKNEWAKNNNIPLVRIPYWERDKITLEMILGEQYLIK